MSKIIRVVSVKPVGKDSISQVYDIGVKDNSNFLIRPKGSNHSILVHNCHNLTGPSEQALLKTLEEPPSRTLFILCTTNPEMLKPAVISRCTQLQLKAVLTDDLVERLVVIAKKEGEDFDNKAVSYTHLTLPTNREV